MSSATARKHNAAENNHEAASSNGDAASSIGDGGRSLNGAGAYKIVESEGIVREKRSAVIHAESATVSATPSNKKFAFTNDQSTTSSVVAEPEHLPISHMMREDPDEPVEEHYRQHLSQWTLDKIERARGPAADAHPENPLHPARLIQDRTFLE